MTWPFSSGWPGRRRSRCATPLSTRRPSSGGAGPRNWRDWPGRSPTASTRLRWPRKSSSPFIPCFPICPARSGCSGPTAHWWWPPRRTFEPGHVQAPGTGLTARVVWPKATSSGALDRLAEPGLVYDDDLRRRVEDMGLRAGLVAPLRTERGILRSVAESAPATPASSPPRGRAGPGLRRPGRPCPRRARGCPPTFARARSGPGSSSTPRSTR